MKKQILEADLVNYNANIRGKNVGDCVKRSISLATGQSYQQIEKELNATQKEVASRNYAYAHDGAWRNSTIYNKVIKAHGGSDPIKVDGIYTLEEFVDNVLGPDGTFLVTTGQKPGSHDHIVCIIDGKIYDSWNSKGQYPYKYYTFEEKVERGAEIDIGKMNYRSVEQLLDSLNYNERLRDKVSTMLGKKGYMDGQFEIVYMQVDGYKIQTRCKIVFPPIGESKERIYRFNVDIVATPFETKDSFNQLVDKAVNVRMYDRMYAVLQNESKQREAIEVANRARQDEQAAKRLNRRLYMSSSELKFYKTLPGWAQGLITYVSIDSPGNYHNSYEVYMVPLPDDPYHDSDDYLMFEGYTASEIRTSIDHYGKTYNVVHPDEL